MNNIKLNREYAKRDMIIYGRVIDWQREASGGILRFEKLTAAQLHALRDAGFIDPGEAQNEAPLAGQIIGFVSKYPGCTAHGYAVSPNRDDYRVSLEGIEFNGQAGPDMIHEFREMFGHADNLEESKYRLYAWFD